MFTFLATKTSFDAATAQQSRVFEREASEAARQQRVETYRALLTAAGIYAVAAAKLDDDRCTDGGTVARASSLTAHSMRP